MNIAGISCKITTDQDKEMFCDNSDDIEIDINRHGLKIYNSGTYEIALSGVTKQVRHVFLSLLGFSMSPLFSPRLQER